MGTDDDARDATPVTHDTDAHRFVSRAQDGTVAGFLAYDPVPATSPTAKNTIVMTHTVVEPEHEGEGIASALARAALDHARAEKMVVIPECEFVRAYVDRHEEYQDLLP